MTINYWPPKLQDRRFALMEQRHVSGLTDAERQELAALDSRLAEYQAEIGRTRKSLGKLPHGTSVYGK
jgi:hypothetical protein